LVQCGACYQLKYKGKSIYVTAVDHASGDQFVLSQAGMGDLLPGGAADAVEKGRITLDSYKEVSRRYCGGA
jgi:hypothetical protein